MPGDDLQPPPAKRLRGRPKGTKNGPHCKKVGRPRKDAVPAASKNTQKSTTKKKHEGGAKVMNGPLVDGHETRRANNNVWENDENDPLVGGSASASSHSVCSHATDPQLDSPRSVSLADEETVTLIAVPPSISGTLDEEVHHGSSPAPAIEDHARLPSPYNLADGLPPSLSVLSNGYVLGSGDGSNPRAVGKHDAPEVTDAERQVEEATVELMGGDTTRDGDGAVRNGERDTTMSENAAASAHCSVGIGEGVKGETPSAKQDKGKGWANHIEKKAMPIDIQPPTIDNTINESITTLFEFSANDDDDMGEFYTIEDDEEDVEEGNREDVTERPTAPRGGHPLIDTHRPSKPRSTIPKWLQDNYQDARETLRKEIDMNPSKRPSCYDRATFIIEPPAPIFWSAQIYQVAPMLFYQPAYFVWMPHYLCRIPCPACLDAGRTLQSGATPMLSPYTWPKAPRRVVDLEENMYIIGYRYWCNVATCKKSYQSWSPAIINVLPPAVACNFSFHLTYRCGLTDRLVGLLRSSFQRGIGPSPFAEMLRTLHLRRYEKHLIQYLEMVKMRKDSPFAKLLTAHARFGAWDDVNGYAGYVPMDTYFRAFYNVYIEKYSSDIDQHMSMLSARILSIDHSFKVTKHLGKQGGEKVFDGLHTATNEYVEVRAMTLTLNKSHDQFMPSLSVIPHSLRKYGHDDIELIFTDNVRGDKTELERVFPSLLQDVSPVPSSSLPPLHIPLKEWKFWDLSNKFQLEGQLNRLMEDFEQVTEKVYVAMDMEWPVDKSTGIFGRVSLITVAYDKTVYFIPLTPYLRDGILRLPSSLLVFLRNSNIQKVGVHIKADFTRLFKDCGFVQSSDKPFEGAVELGTMAKDRNLTDHANISLADLTAKVLRQYLNKDDAIRCSAWDSPALTDDQIMYAACDVYASWSICTAFLSSPVDQPVTAETPGGTRVKLLSRDRSTVAAYGIIAPDRPKTFAGINITKTRVIVNMTSIIIPSYLVRSDLVKPPGEKPLSSFASHLPFSLVCNVKDLVTNSCVDESPPQRNQSAPLPALPFTTSSENEPLVNPDTTFPSCSTASDLDDVDMAAWHNHLEPDPEAEQSLDASSPDSVALLYAAELDHITSSDTANGAVRTRIVGDLWHLMDQFKIPRDHGLRIDFAHALRDALLLPDEEDKAAVEAVLKGVGRTWDQMLIHHSDWIWRRTQRFASPPNIMYSRVSEVLKLYGPMKDATTGQPLFNNLCWEKAKNVLENIRLGYYSDPPGVNLYSVVGRDKDGLTIYWCMRGTNNVEGGIHQNIAKWFGSYNTSPCFAVNLLRDYCLTHNLKVGTQNHTGKRYQGSYDIWQWNHISRLVDETRLAFPSHSHEPAMLGWVNGDNFEHSSESFGILPLSDHTRSKLGMLPYHPDFASEQKIRHAYLAQQQQTRIAILPVHTVEECSLFGLYLRQPNGHLAGRTQPNWVAFSSDWSKHADGVHIFYKLPEHLKTYFKSWMTYRNQQNSIAMNRDDYE